MLTPPKALAGDPAFVRALELCEDCFLKPEEVARHWRTTTQRLGVMRRCGTGPRFVKFGHGSVRYRMSDVLAYEQAGLVQSKVFKSEKCQ